MPETPDSPTGLPQQASPRSGDEAGLAPTDQPLQAPGGNSAARSLGRYQLGEAVDGGVNRVRDRLLDRGAVARVTPLAGADDLEQEAGFLARLDHQGAPVVFDFVRGDAGAMLVMRRVEGPTLAAAIAQARTGALPAELASPAAVVHLLLRICDVVAAVHAQGVVHHALSPERIVLGVHGQVVIEDWSAAMAEKRSPATLRYVSSRPAPHALALDGLHQDVRSLGAILFACLALRPPQPQDGDILGNVTPDERRRLPAGLEAVVRRALDSSPGGGYASVGELAQDLMRFSEGLHPAAYVPGRFARLGAWAHRRRRPLLLAAAACLALGAALAGVWGRQIADLASWHVVVAEDFSDPTWTRRWVSPPTVHGMFTTEGRRLVSTSDRDALLIFRERLATPVAIEYTGEILAGSQPCDLSVQWSEDSGVADEPARFAQTERSYMIQAGAFSNEFCAIYENPGRRLLAHANRQLESGRKYRFRVELDGTRISMLIDGERVLDYSDDIPTQSGYLALYAYYRGKAFEDVRILARSPANRPSPLATADLAFLQQRFDAAAGQYGRVAESTSEAPVVQQALYRKGLSEWYLGQTERAAATWSRVNDPVLGMRIASDRLERVFGADQGTPHLSGFEELYRSRPEAREYMRRSWQRVVQQQTASSQRNLLILDYFLAMREKLFPEDESARYVAVTTLLALDRHQEVLAKFPQERNSCVRAMLALGRTQQVLEMPGVSVDDRRQALSLRGEFAKALELKGIGPPWSTWMRIRMGAAESAMQDELDAAYPVLLHLGRAPELLASSASIGGAAVNDVLISLGRLQEAANDGLPGVPGSGQSVTAMLLLGEVDLAERIGRKPRDAIRMMQALEAGDEAAYRRHRDRIVHNPNLRGIGGWFPAEILRPFAAWTHGDAKALEAQIRPRLDLLSGVFARSPWFVGRAVLGDCPVDEVLAMPCVSEAEAWRAVAAGMRAEVQGDRSAAIAAYTAFTSLPVHRRLLSVNAPDPDVEWFVAWRLRALAR